LNVSLTVILIFFVSMRKHYEFLWFIQGTPTELPGHGGQKNADIQVKKTGSKLLFKISISVFRSAAI